jgi:hypothetical protein
MRQWYQKNASPPTVNSKKANRMDIKAVFQPCPQCGYNGQDAHFCTGKPLNKNIKREKGEQNQPDTQGRQPTNVNSKKANRMERIDLPNGYYFEKFDDGSETLFELYKPNGDFCPEDIYTGSYTPKEAQEFAAAMNASPTEAALREALERIEYHACDGLNRAKVFNEHQRQFIMIFGNIMQDAQAALALSSTQQGSDDNVSNS